MQYNNNNNTSHLLFTLCWALNQSLYGFHLLLGPQDLKDSLNYHPVWNT